MTHLTSAIDYIRKHAPELAIALWAGLAPIHPALGTVAALPLVDLVLALIVARRSGRPLTSTGLKRTVAKILMYELATVLAFVTEQFLTGSLIPCLKVVTALIGVTELKSCLEHLDSISNGNFFQSVLNKLSPPQLPPKDPQ